MTGTSSTICSRLLRRRLNSSTATSTRRWSILKTRCAFAQGDPGNTGEIGDIYSLPPKLWLVRNEVGGRTVMYPEDY